MNPRTILAALFMLPAIACTAFATYLFKTGASSATYTDPLLALILGTIFLVISLWLTYAVPYPQPQQEPERKPQRPSGFSLVQLMVVIVIAAILMAISWPALTSAFRGATQPAIDEKVRAAAVEKMYEDKGLQFEEIYAVTAKAEWGRRGWAWPSTDPGDPSKPYYYTPEHVAKQLETLFPTTPPDPPFIVPDRTSRQAVIDLGLTEPDPKGTFGMQ